MTRQPANTFKARPNVSETPRRVRGGVRLVAKEMPLRLSWPGRRWMHALERNATPEAIAEGFEYARKGQTRTLEFEPGRVLAAVQGRAVRSYRVVIQFQALDDAQWDAVVDRIVNQASYGAMLLSGEAPESLTELFDDLPVPLVAGDTDDPLVSCTCDEGIPWCKHVCCAVLLTAEALEKDMLKLFTLRGLPADELLERVRDRRESLGLNSGSGGPAAGTTELGADRDASPPLDACIDSFWDAGKGLNELDTSIRTPEASHALLRRLGPSPFQGAKFPLVGLLATCYDVISESISREDEAAEQGPDGGFGDADPVDDTPA